MAAILVQLRQSYIGSVGLLNIISPFFGIHVSGSRSEKELTTRLAESLPRTLELDMDLIETFVPVNGANAAIFIGVKKSP
jgi:hypothetical protein